MRSAIAIAALLCAPEVFAVALPHIPKLNSRWYHNDELDANDATLVKRRKADDHAHELEPRRGIPLEILRPSSTPAVTTPIGTGATTPSSTPSSIRPLGMLPRPAATLHNPFVGNHPFIGHGPVVSLPTTTPSASGYAENFTLTYLATGTTPPIANATATIYRPPIIFPITNTTANVTSCDAVPELIDSNGNFLPGELQPKYNGSSNCTSSIVNVTYAMIEPETDKVVIEGHMRGENEIVEVDITPLPANITSWNNTAENNDGTYQGANPTGFAYSSSSLAEFTGMSSFGTSSTAAPAPIPSSSVVHRQKVPTSSTPGFTGPKVRRAVVHPVLDGEKYLENLADLDFD